MQSVFVRNVMMIVTGTAGAQMIAMAFMPFITRIYGPEAFGLLGTFISVTTILMPMAALTYPIAIILPKDNAEALGIAKLSILIAFITSSVVALILWCFGEEIALLFDAENIIVYLALIPVAMIFSAIHQVNEQWVMRLHLYKTAAKVALSQSILINGAKISIGFFHPIAFTLIAMQVVSSALYGLLLWFGMRRSLVSSLVDIKSDLTIKELASKYKDFALYRAPQVTINAVSQSLPVLMLAFYFDITSAGFYALGRTIVGVPSALLGKAVGDVFYPRISAAANQNEKLQPLVKKATLLLALVGAIPFSFLILLGPWLFSLLFGSEWEVAGEYARWLSVWMFFMFLNAPSIKAIPVITAQGLHLIYTNIGVILRILALYFGYAVFSSDIVSVAAFSLVGGLLNMILIFGVLRLCSKYDMEGKACG